MPNFYNLLRARKFTTAADTAVEIAPYNSATPNFSIEAGGKLKWSSGSAAADTTLYRSAANVLKTDDSFDIASGQTYKVDGADVLSATALGSNVVSSSLTSVGTLSSLTAATPTFTGPTTVNGTLTAATPTFNGTTTVNGNASITGNAVWHTTFTESTTTNYLILSSDDGKVVLTNSSSANILYIPHNANTSLPVGTQVTIVQKGAGQTTIAGLDPAVTLRSNTTLKLRSQYSVVTVLKIATDEWLVFGDLAAF